MLIESSSAVGQFNTRATLQSTTGGSMVTRVGLGMLYGGYAWRGSSRPSTTTAIAPDDLSNDASEVMTSAPDESSAEGRWFWGQYQELGFDIKIQRASSDTTLLGIDRPLLKVDSQS